MGWFQKAPTNVLNDSLTLFSLIINKNAELIVTVMIKPSVNQHIEMFYIFQQLALLLRSFYSVAVLEGRPEA